MIEDFTDFSLFFCIVEFQFNIDPNQAFGAYGQGIGEFSYDGSGSAYGAMGGMSLSTSESIF